MRLASPLLLAVLGALLIAPAALAGEPEGPPVPDPAVRGAFETARADYDAGDTVVGGGSSSTTFPEELKGSVHRPTTGNGPFPVLVFLHGRHSTCAVAGQDALGSPCPSTPLTDSIDSYKGYAYLADDLASHGYVVMSVNANGTNSYDLSATDAGANARSQIIAKSLDLLASWNAAPGPAGIGDTLIGRLDLSRIGLMGHSRGGEGVADFIEYNRTRPADSSGPDGAIDSGPRYPGLRAVFSLAPIDRKNQEPHGVAFATLLPYCDGDVSDLSGSRAFERGKDRNSAEGFPTYQFGVQGTNHNFYNTVWTGGDEDPSGDDNATTTDTACARKGQPATSIRLTPPDQRRVGLSLMAAFLRRHVGGETGFEPLLRGAARLPASGCPAQSPLCPGLVQWSYIAPAAQRRVLVGPRPEGDAAVEATGAATVAACSPASNGTGCPTAPNRSTTPQLALTWDGPGALVARLGDALGDARPFGTLVLRTGVNFADTARNPAGADQDLDVRLTDAAGATAAVRASDYSTALRPSPGSSQREVVLQQVRVPLAAFAGVDLGAVRTLALELGGRTPKGSIEVAGMAFQEAAAPAGAAAGAGAGGDGGGQGDRSAPDTNTGSGPAGSSGSLPAARLRLAAAVARRQLVPTLRRYGGVRTRVRCSKACAVRVEVRADSRTRRALRLRRSLAATATARLTRAGRRVLVARLPRTALRRLARLPRATLRQLRFAVRVTARDGVTTRTVRRGVQVRERSGA